MYLKAPKTGSTSLLTLLGTCTGGPGDKATCFEPLKASPCRALLLPAATAACCHCLLHVACQCCQLAAGCAAVATLAARAADQPALPQPPVHSACLPPRLSPLPPTLAPTASPPMLPTPASPLPHTPPHTACRPSRSRSMSSSTLTILCTLWSATPGTVPSAATACCPATWRAPASRLWAGGTQFAWT
jgi:hypothetical protein